MKAKLIKERFDFYGLKVDDKIIATNDVEVNKMFNYPHTISLRNCQAIERGYDLDELVKERFGEAFWHDGDKYFKEGFQKALELIGDKKFSEEDIRNAIHFGQFGECNNKSTTISFIQSLQQTEWDCIVEMEEVLYTNEYIPKLDANNCLILKRLEI